MMAQKEKDLCVDVTQIEARPGGCNSTRTPLCLKERSRRGGTTGQHRDPPGCAAVQLIDRHPVLDLSMACTKQCGGSLPSMCWDGSIYKPRDLDPELAGSRPSSGTKYKGPWAQPNHANLNSQPSPQGPACLAFWTGLGWVPTSQCAAVYVSRIESLLWWIRLFIYLLLGACPCVATESTCNSKIH
jgi:hypothetical protein